MNEIEENGLKYKLNEKNKTAEVIRSPNASGSIIVPRFIEYKNEKYTVKSVREAFKRTKVESVTFPEDSEVEYFYFPCDNYSIIKQLFIPASVTQILLGIYSFPLLTDIKVSPKNQIFAYINNQLLVGKSIDYRAKPTSNEYSILYFARSDIVNVIIPPHIQKIKEEAFFRHEKLYSVEFPEDSQIKSFDGSIFFCAGITRLKLPPSIEEFSTFSFRNTPNLVDIQVSPQNKHLSYIDNGLLLLKSKQSDAFDVLLFARRDIEHIKIPSSIKIIFSYAFQDCKKIKTFSFEQNSLLEEIGAGAFTSSNGIKDVVFSESLKMVDACAFESAEKLSSLTFLGKSIEFKSSSLSTNIPVVSLPNATEIKFEIQYLGGIQSFQVPKNCKIEGKSFDEYLKDKVKYIEKPQKANLNQFKLYEEVDLEPGSGLNLKLNNKDHTAVVFKSSKATGNIFIPRLFQRNGEEYLITSVRTSIENNQVKSFTFAEDSEVISFGSSLVSSSNLEVLQIPPKLKILENRWNSGLSPSVKIEISPKNNNFILMNENLLIGKSDEKSQNYDILYLAKFDDGEEVILPSQIKIIKEFSFQTYNYKSLKFADDSELKIIEVSVLTSSSIECLELPPKLEFIGENNFNYVNNLIKIKVSPKNNFFKVLNNQYLLKRSSKESKNFDFLVVAVRDIEKAIIPNYIKIIGDHAFDHCTKCKSVQFESKTSLEEIRSFAFSHCGLSEEFIIPETVTKLGASFCYNQNLKSVKILGENVAIPAFCFTKCDNLSLISFPKAEKILLETASIGENISIQVRRDAKISGTGFERLKNQITYIEDENNVIDCKLENKNNSILDNSNAKNDDKSHKIDETKGLTENSKIDSLIDRIRYFENKLSRYEEVTPLDLSQINNEREEKQAKQKETQQSYFIGEDDEEHHEILEILGEGASSIAYKVIDKRTSRIMCKKVLKIKEESTTFKNCQNIIREFEVLYNIDFPSICKAIGLNTQEKCTTSVNNDSITTIAIFIEYLPYKLKSCLEKNILSNTLKARIAVEVAFGMLYLHSNRMMHRDLKIDNIMLNSIFEAKIIDFDLVHVDENDNYQKTLTTGIGTLAYMSPEMQNEEEYDYKTDVYSYGIVLYVLFTGNLPKQSMKDKLNNKPIQFPPPSRSLSSYCIELIKKCLSYEPPKRPSFEDILENMKSNLFEFASEIDTDAVMRRFRELNWLKNEKLKSH